MTDEKAIVARYKWMPSQGKDLFSAFMFAVENSVLQNPLGDLTTAERLNATSFIEVPVGDRGSAAKVRDLLKGDYFAGEWSVDQLLRHQALRQGIVEALCDVTLLSGLESPDGSGSGAPIDILLSQGAEVRQYTDLEFFGRKTDYAIAQLMENTLRFAFVSNFAVANRALAEAPFLSDAFRQSHNTPALYMRLLVSVMRTPTFVTRVMEPLAATGFGVLSARFQDLGPRGEIPFGDLPLPDPATRLVTWGHLDGGFGPSLVAELRNPLVKMMATDGRTRFPDRDGPPKDPELQTSAGCPVRFQIQTTDGPRSGISVTNDLCIAALNAALTLHQQHDHSLGTSV